MTKDASRRLKLAKKAAASILGTGGSISEAATAAQAFGTPADGEESDESGGDESGSDDAEELSLAVDALNVDKPVSQAGGESLSSSVAEALAGGSTRETSQQAAAAPADGIERDGPEVARSSSTMTSVDIT